MGGGGAIRIQFLMLILLLGFLCHGSESIAGGEIAAVRCIEGERQALLHFKAVLTDSSGRLSSWIGDDCCSWRGVGCSNVTGHVIKLNLPNQPVLRKFESPPEFYYIDGHATYMSSLGGKVSPSLLKLKHLKYLDLSFNNFQGIHIPEFMGSLENLRYLNLSHASFSGTIPPHLGNLSKLQYLDLSLDWPLHDDELLTINNIQWLSGLSSLRYLNMNYLSFKGKSSSDWIQAVTMLPSLSELHLSSCQLSKIPFSLPLFANLTSLLVLDLSYNLFFSTIPPWLFNITTLTVLDLSRNDFNGPIPYTLGNLCNLQTLDLSYCYNISGEITEYVNSLSMCNSSSLETLDLHGTGVSDVIPSSIGNLSSLMVLDLSVTQLSGSIPESIGNLSSLIILDLYYTPITGPIPMSIGRLSSLIILDLSFTQIDGTVPESIGELSELEVLTIVRISLRGVISERHFKNLKSLTELNIQSEAPNKALVFEVGWDWIPTFSHLEAIEISDIQMGPTFPSWLATQKGLVTVVLTNVGISDTIPDSFWNYLCAQQSMETLDLSYNQINGTIPNSLDFGHVIQVDLSYNRIEGSLPLWSNVSYLFLGTNLFTGQIPHNIGEVLGSDAVSGLDFSGNFLSGRILSSICELKSLQWLALSNNSLWGELPHCWKHMKGLQILDLSYNNLSGKIPLSIGSLSSLQYLILGSNNFHGKLPSSLQNCTSLYVIDLGRNGFTGNIPTWIGESLSSLQIISLRFNFLTGKIPLQVCNLSMLHLLDLSYNNLSGFIPQCLGDLSALNSKDSRHWLGGATNGSYYDREHMMVVTKGRELEYTTTLDLVNCIDLSNNHLSGEITDGITRLVLLGTLNLSRNHLIGKIPEKIGLMKYLETLDLSINELSGQIPPSMSLLSFLTHLNFSHNNLSGKIPTSTQLQSIGDASMYVGNPGLCGMPLANTCPGVDTFPPPPNVNGENDDKVDEEWMDMQWFYIGIIMGFIVGFWAVWGSLFFNKSWRIAYFRCIEYAATHICGGS